MDSYSTSNSSLTVALFGFYEYGNFGDDLMAVLFGQHLQALGAILKVYKLRADVAAEFGFTVANSVDTLLANADVLVYGGGGAFLGNQRTPEFDERLNEVCDECSRRSIPIFMCSVGGEGKRKEQLTPARRRILDSAAYISFRNEEDLILVADRNQDAYPVYPDIVWTTSHHFLATERTNSDAIRIGVDGNLLRSPKRRRLFAWLKTFFWLRRRRCRFVSFEQSSTAMTFDGFDEAIQYADGIAQFIANISQLDALVTDRLHLGLTALGYDVPVFLPNPQPKAKLLYQQVGLEQYLLTSRLSLARFPLLLSTSRTLSAMRPSMLNPNIAQIKLRSELHLTRLTQMLETIFLTE